MRLHYIVEVLLLFNPQLFRNRQEKKRSLEIASFGVRLCFRLFLHLNLKKCVPSPADVFNYVCTCMRVIVSSSVYGQRKQRAPDLSLDKVG